MKIVGLNLIEAPNVGDRYCSPLHYFDFPGTVIKGNIRDFAKHQDADAVIFGGGALAQNVAERAPSFASSLKIGWGLGHTQRGVLGPHGNYSALLQDLDLYGIRDWGLASDDNYVPCASCMLPQLDRAYKIEHEFVYYGHEKLTPLAGLEPRMTNSELNIQAVIEFLGSGETIVTSSYHGMYWGTLLGRKVIAIPFGSKFFHFKYPVPLRAEWKEGAAAAKAFPEALGESRAYNQNFHKKVLEVLGNVKSKPRKSSKPASLTQLAQKLLRSQ